MASLSPTHITRTRLLHQYEGAIQGKPLPGMAIYDFNQREQEWQMAGIDSCYLDTEMMFSTGAGGVAERPQQQRRRRPIRTRRCAGGYPRVSE
jgi:hypothetical protein